MMIHEDLQSMTMELLTEAARKHYGKDRCYSALFNPRTLQFELYLHQDVVEDGIESRSPRQLELSAARSVEPQSSVGEELCFVIDYENETSAAEDVVENFQRGATREFRSEAIAALKESARRFLPTSRSERWIGEYFGLKTGGVAKGEFFVHPAGDPIAGERAGLVATLELGGITYQEINPKHWSLDLPPSESRILIPEPMIPEVIRPLIPDDEARDLINTWKSLGHRPKSGEITTELIAAAAAELHSAPGPAVLDVLSRFKPTSPISYADQRAIIRIKVLTVWELARALVVPPQNIERVFESPST